MGSSVSDDSSSNGRRSDGQLLRLDIEQNSQSAAVKRQNFISRPSRKFPLLRKEKWAFTGLLIVACVAISACIAQALYISKLKKGLVRIANDPFDNSFARVDRDSPMLLDEHRQSFIHNSVPVPVHSHNDYYRRIPLFEALGSGCISVEADVHLHGSDLLIGHSANELSSELTLRSMYLEPLQRLIERQNANLTDGSWRGVFNRSPQQTFVLLVDQKTSSSETFAALDAQLQPLRDLNYLTYWNGTHRVMGPLTIVASGTTPFSAIMSLNPMHRDIFWDAKLEQLIHIDDNFNVEPARYGYNISNSYFASTQWGNARLFPWYWYPNGTGTSSPPESLAFRDIGASQIEQARARGLLSRYWDIPSEPPNMRDVAWRVLVDSKVDILNMDDLGIVRARARGWGDLHKQ